MFPHAMSRYRKSRPPRGSAQLWMEELEQRAVPTGDFVNAFSIVSSNPNTFLQCDGIAADADGNSYLVGRFGGTVDFDPNGGVWDLTSFDNTDMFVAKYSPAGDLIWAKQVGRAGGYAGCYGHALAVVGSENILIAGRFVNTVDFDPGPGIHNLTSTSGGFYEDMFVLKLDANGSFVWAKQVSGPNLEDPQTIAADSSGNVFIGGAFQEGVDFDPGDGTFFLTCPTKATFVMKLSDAGDFDWAASAAPTSADPGTRLALDRSGNVLVSGKFSNVVDFDPSPAVFNLDSVDGGGFLWKLTEQGALLWARNTGASVGLTVDDANNIYTTDAGVSKFNSEGDLLWAKAVGGTVFAMTRGSNGNLFLAGSFRGATTGFGQGPWAASVTGYGYNDVYVASVDQNGDLAWVGALGGSDNDYAVGVAVFGQTDVYTVGNFNSATMDVDPGVPAFDLTNTNSPQWAIFFARITNLTPNVVSPGDQSSLEADTVSLPIAASDPSGDKLEYTATGLPPGLGIDPLTGVISGTISNSAANASPYTVTVFVTDHTSMVSTTFAWSISNPAPVANGDSYTLFEDTFLNTLTIGVLDNDTDDDGLTATLVNGPQHGNLTLNADGSFFYVPALDFNGTDGFTYKAGDGAAFSDSATVTFTVLPVDDPVNANDDTAAVNEGAFIDINVTANDAGGGTDPLTVQSLTQPAHGTAAINGDGTVRYTPALGFFGTDTFTYTATDGITADTAAVTIGVTGVRYISTRNGGTVFSANGNRRTFTDADILRVEIAPDGRYTYALYFDGSDAGLTTAGEDIDAFAFLPDGSIIVSTAGRYKVTGTGGSLTGGGEDLLQFTPTQFGTTTVGTWTRYFDGSDVGLKGRAENVDAVAVLPDGRLLLSVAKNATVTGNITALGQDLMAFTPTVLGDTTAGTFAPYFQGNQVGLDDPKGENITAIFADTTGEGDPILFMSTAGNFNVQGLAGSADDVFAFYPTSLGPTTDGTFDTGLALDGDELGLAGFGVDGVAFGVSL